MLPAFTRSLGVICALVLGGAAPALRAAEPVRPALVVVIAIDQFRHDYLERFRSQFVPGGFRLLLEGGADFSDCHYRHAITKTAPGHALMLSGVHADVHGIIANDWLDRVTLKRGNSVDDETVQPLGYVETHTGVRMPGSVRTMGCSPRNYLTTTVGDELKLARAGRPKVIAVSSKDRSAVLLGGKLADAAYWMDQGRIISSTYYMKELPAWVRSFNNSGLVEACFGKIWDRLLPAAIYDATQGPDDQPGEYVGLGLTRTFPKRLDGGAPTITPAFYEAFEHTPFKSEVMMDFVRAVVENENLGRRGVTDMLCVSFSVNDTVGHDCGPDSHEVMDITLRTDRLLAAFFTYLDKRVGLKNCTIVLTADHGSTPLPERVKAINPVMDAGRVDNVRILNTCEAALTRAYGPAGENRRWLAIDASWLLFVPEVLEQKKVTRAEAEIVVRDALLTIDFVQSATTRTQLEAGAAPGQFGPALQLSFNRARSGDVYYLSKPFWIDRPKSGTTHGTPYNYDSHVPLLWYGVGVKPGAYPQRIGVDDLAPTLAHLLGLPAPPLSAGHVLF